MPRAPKFKTTKKRKAGGAGKPHKPAVRRAAAKRPARPAAIRPRPKPAAALGNYEAKKESSRLREARISATARDIAAGWPGPGDEKRRAACRLDLERDLRTYYPRAFPKPFSRAHQRDIQRTQLVILEGGTRAIGRFRGGGKTTIAVRAVIWAEKYGHRRYSCLVGATGRDANANLKTIKTELLLNPLLGRDFPEICYPIRCANGDARKAIGQLWEGQRTLLEWARDQLCLPTIPPSPVSGHVISVRPMLGAIRGQQHELATGEIIRPDLFFFDDPQTRRSAKSRDATAEREAIILGDALGSAGGDQAIAALMACTPIFADDLAMRFLDHKRHPEWQGEKTPLVYSFPTDEKLWNQYRSQRETAIINGEGEAAAAEFYAKHREAMDAGAEVAWPEWHPQEKLSGIQYAMDLMYDRGRAAFFAEYQMEPSDQEEHDSRPQLKAEIVRGKGNGIPRGIAPTQAEHLAAYVDVHQEILYWVVAAGWHGLGGHVVDYGTWPRQPVQYFSQKSPPLTLAQQYPRHGKEAAILAGLEELTGKLISREWLREDQAIMRIEKLLPDAKWETDLVKAFCRRSTHAAIIMPAQGFYLKPEYDWSAYFSKKPGGKTGFHTRIPPPENGVRYVLLDTDAFKKLATERLRLPVGDSLGWTLFGRDASEHLLFGDHCAAEKSEWRQTGDRGKWHWELPPGHPDNHLWDSTCGVLAALSMLGLLPPGLLAVKPRATPGERPTLRQMAGR